MYLRGESESSDRSDFGVCGLHRYIDPVNEKVFRLAREPSLPSIMNTISSQPTCMHPLTHRHAYNARLSTNGSPCTPSQPSFGSLRTAAPALNHPWLFPFLLVQETLPGLNRETPPSPKPPSPSTVSFAAVAALTGNTPIQLESSFAKPKFTREIHFHPSYHITVGPSSHPLLPANRNLNNTTTNTADSTTPVLSSSVPHSSACRHHPLRSPKHSTSHPHPTHARRPPSGR